MADVRQLLEKIKQDFHKYFHSKEWVYNVPFKRFTYRADGDYLPYDPTINQAQDEFHTAAREGKRYLAMFGASGLGKSMSAAREAVLHMFYPGTTTWLVGADYNAASKEFDYCWHDLVQDNVLRELVERAVNNPSNGDLHIRFKWGSEIRGKSAKNADDGSLLGEGVDCIVLCEGSRIPEDVFNRYLERALSRREGRVICNTTPKGKNWVYHKFYKPAVDGDPLFWSADPYPATVNPFYSKEEFERQKLALGEDSLEFQEQFLGRFVHYAGLCYPEFKAYGDESHILELCPRDDIDWSWPRWVVIDPHFSIPHAVGFYTVDRSNCPIIYDELWIGGGADALTTAIMEKHHEHGGIIREGDRIRLPDGRERRELIAEFGGNPVVTLIDTSALIKSDLHGGTSMQDEILAAGLKTRAVQKTGIESRILTIKRRLKERVPILGDPSGKSKPWLTVAKHCVRHIWEFEHAEWQEWSGRTDRTPKQSRKDKDDHFLNCFEYFVAENPVWDIHSTRSIYRPDWNIGKLSLDKSVRFGMKDKKSRPWRSKDYALRL